MGLEDLHLREPLVTNFAFERPFAGVGPQMYFKVGYCVACLEANFAFVM